MKFHYFNQSESDQDDLALGIAKKHGWVPTTCLLGGATVMSELNMGHNPCWKCEGPREICKGKAKR